MAGEVLHALERFGVTPTPENYRVWYVHLSGELPALSARLRQIVEAGEAGGAGQCWASSQRSASMAAMQPEPAAVMAWR